VIKLGKITSEAHSRKVMWVRIAEATQAIIANASLDARLMDVP
jgi:hypothetical protein